LGLPADVSASVLYHVLYPYQGDDSVLADVMAFESARPIIDYYEAFVWSLRSLVAGRAPIAIDLGDLAKADARLRAVIARSGTQQKLDPYGGVAVEQAVAAYLGGDYEKSGCFAAEILNEASAD